MIKLIVTKAIDKKIQKLKRKQAVVIQRFNKLFIESTQVCVNVMLDAIVDHIDTGMSAASLEGLAARVRLKSAIHATIVGKAHGIRLKSYHPKDSRFPRGSGNKSLSQGINLGNKAYTFNLGTASSPNCRFTFKINILQYYLHENGFAQLNAWDSLKKGKVAFIQYWNGNKKRIINGG